MTEGTIAVADRNHIDEGEVGGDVVLDLSTSIGKTITLAENAAIDVAWATPGFTYVLELARRSSVWDGRV